MKKQKTVAIVGAGITGITAAYFEAIKGNQVYLIELGKKPGGLLSSESNEFGTFDYGTHVGTALGVKQLDEFLFGGMRKKEFEFFNPGESGNYYAGQMSSISPFVNIRFLGQDLSIEANRGLLNLKQAAAPQNLEELMIARYGRLIYEEIFKGVVQKFMGCCASKLSRDVLYFFDMNRLIAFDSQITDQLKTGENYDNILGFHYPCPGRQKIYPKSGGISYWINFLMKKLKKAGVNFLSDTKVDAVQLKKGKVTHIDLGKGPFKIDKLIWTIPAAFFSRLADASKKLFRPKFRKTGLYNFSFLKPLQSKCYYINVYDESLHSGRLTLYQNLTKPEKYYSCTVEVLQDDEFDFGASVDTILDELHTMGLVEKGNQCVYKGMIPVNNGFPILDLPFQKQSELLLDALRSNFRNVTFLGRGNGGFFMRDVLIHTYKTLIVEELSEKEKIRLKMIS